MSISQLRKISPKLPVFKFTDTLSLDRCTVYYLKSPIVSQSNGGFSQEGMCQFTLLISSIRDKLSQVDNFSDIEPWLAIAVAVQSINLSKPSLGSVLR
jgi:hypothetical protein